MEGEGDVEEGAPAISPDFCLTITQQAGICSRVFLLGRGQVCQSLNGASVIAYRMGADL